MNVREDFGCFRDHRGVHVDDLAVTKPGQARGFVQEYAAPRPLPARVGVGEKRPDVLLAQRAQESVAQRVHQDVRIRVALQSFAMRNLHTAQDEFASGNQRMHVITDSNMNHRFGL